MPRIDVSNPEHRWQWACPAPGKHRSWRIVDGEIECRHCGDTYGELRNLQSGELVPRDEIEIVGRGSDTKGAFGEPTVTDGGEDVP